MRVNNKEADQTMSTQLHTTGLTKINDTFLPMIESQLTGKGIYMDGYSKQCVLNALAAVNTALDAKGTSFGDPQLDQSNITTILMQIASLKLNSAASPREVFFSVRNVNTKKKDESNKDIWKKQVEMGIEGDGNDAILSRFGRDVAKVGQFWLVREHDHFEYPTYTGFDVIPPKWTPTGKGDVIRVVYPILKNDGTIEFYISERDDVAKNLIAHINNNLMNETFGLLPSGKTRFDATDTQKKEIAAKKAEVLNRAKDLGLGSLDDTGLQQYISPAWSEYHSREQMLIRKMRNNIVKKIPKDFGSAFVEMIHNEVTDESYSAIRKEITENANSVPIDIETEPVVEQPTSPDPQHTEPPAEQPTSQVSGKGKPSIEDIDIQHEMQFENEPAAAGTPY
jgi:hypothetical protein